MNGRENVPAGPTHFRGCLLIRWRLAMIRIEPAEEHRESVSSIFAYLRLVCVRDAVGLLYLASCF